VHVELVTIIVDDYDAAIAFFVDAIGFDLVEDSPSLTNDGRPKRWVVVRSAGAATGILLAQADGPSSPLPLASKPQAAWGSSCASTTSTRPTGAWSTTTCGS